MSTYDELAVGDVFETPSRTITDHEVRALIGIGGYTHPLFTDPSYAAASVFGRTPLPGEAVLHLMGGLAEQSGRFDETVVALTGFEDVRFRAPAFAGDALRVTIEVIAKEAAGTRGTLGMRWLCTNDGGDVVCEATATMLFRLDRPGRGN